ncbi:hypothetical protein UlMin_004012, partial [Ulmus minor]
DTLALMAELEKNKEGKSRGEAKGGSGASTMNPLLNNPTSFSVKRRYLSISSDGMTMWCSKTKTPKRFINNGIRNNFHYKNT